MGLLRMVMALALMVGGWYLYDWYDKKGQEEEGLIRSTQHAVQRIEQEVKYRAAMGKVPLNNRGWPETIDPEWFHGVPPQNAVAGHSGPWVEVAAPEEFELHDPPLRLSLDETIPTFWYNPCKGIVRARVGQALSDERAVEIYNRVNGTSVSSLFPMGDAASAEAALAAAAASKSNMTDHHER